MGSIQDCKCGHPGRGHYMKGAARSGACREAACGCRAFAPGPSVARAAEPRDPMVQRPVTPPRRDFGVQP